MKKLQNIQATWLIEEVSQAPAMDHTTMSDLMLNFPNQRSRLAYNQHRRVVKFADTTRIYMVERHEDSQKYNVTRHELWYTETEYYMDESCI